MNRLRQLTEKRGVLLYSVCAAIFCAIVVTDVINKTYSDDMVMFVLKILCIPLWIAMAVAAAKRGKGDKEKK